MQTLEIQDLEVEQKEIETTDIESEEYEKPYKSIEQFIEGEKEAISWGLIRSAKREYSQEQGLKIIKSFEIEPAMLPVYKNSKVNNWIKDNDDSYETRKAIIKDLEEESIQLQKEEKILFYKEGHLIEITKKADPYFFIKKHRVATNLFTNLSDNEINERFVYYKYVSIIAKQGRTIDDIYMIDTKKIQEIYLLDDETQFEQVENYLKLNKVSNPELKRAIYLMNMVKDLDIESAVEQAQKEATAKKMDIKSGKTLKERHKKLTLKHRSLNKTFDDFVKKYYEKEKERIKLTRRNNKQAEQIETLKTEVKTYKMKLRKVERVVNKTNENNDFITELKTIIQESNSTFSEESVEEINSNPKSDNNQVQTYVGDFTQKED